MPWQEFHDSMAAGAACDQLNEFEKNNRILEVHYSTLVIEGTGMASILVRYVQRKKENQK